MARRKLRTDEAHATKKLSSIKAEDDRAEDEAETSHQTTGIHVESK